MVRLELVNADIYGACLYLVKCRTVPSILELVHAAHVFFYLDL